MRNLFIVFGVLLVLASCQPEPTVPSQPELKTPSMTIDVNAADVACGSYPVYIPVRSENLDRSSIVWTLDGAGSLEKLPDGNVRYKAPKDCFDALDSSAIVNATAQSTSKQVAFKIVKKTSSQPVFIAGNKVFSIDTTGQPANDLFSPKNLKPIDTLAFTRKSFVDKDGWVWLLLYNNENPKDTALRVYPNGFSGIGSDDPKDSYVIEINGIADFAIDSYGDVTVFQCSLSNPTDCASRKYFRSQLDRFQTFILLESLKLDYKCIGNDIFFDVADALFASCYQYTSEKYIKRFYIKFESNFSRIPIEYGSFGTSQSQIVFGRKNDAIASIECCKYLNTLEKYLRISRKDSVSGLQASSVFELTDRTAVGLTFDKDGDLWVSEKTKEYSAVPEYALSEYSLSSTGTADILTLKSRVTSVGFGGRLDFYGF
jgi:hypothetical protein